MIGGSSINVWNNLRWCEILIEGEANYAPLEKWPLHKKFPIFLLFSFYTLAATTAWEQISHDTNLIQVKRCLMVYNLHSFYLLLVLHWNEYLGCQRGIGMEIHRENGLYLNSFSKTCKGCCFWFTRWCFSRSVFQIKRHKFINRLWYDTVQLFCFDSNWKR